MVSTLNPTLHEIDPGDSLAVSGKRFDHRSTGRGSTAASDHDSGQTRGTSVLRNGVGSQDPGTMGSRGCVVVPGQIQALVSGVRIRRHYLHGCTLPGCRSTRSVLGVLRTEQCDRNRKRSVGRFPGKGVLSQGPGLDRDRPVARLGAFQEIDSIRAGTSSK